MQRAVRADAGALALDKRAPVPVPAPGEALLRVERVGLSHADTEACAPGSGFRGVAGREPVAVVESVHAAPDAPERPAARPGQRAASLVGRRVVASARIPCGSCDLCARGAPLHCRNAVGVGCAGPGGSRDGALAERIALPLAALTPVPDGVDLDAASLAHDLAAGMHAANLAANRAYVTVLGDGPVALLAAQVAARSNQGVRLLGHDERRMSLCEKWGVKRRPLAEAGRRADQDAVIECTGSPEGAAAALRLVRPRGRIILACARAGAAAELAPIVEAEVEIVGSRGGSLGEALAALRAGAVSTEGIIERRIALEAAPDAIRALGRGAAGKIVVDL